MRERDPLDLQFRFMNRVLVTVLIGSLGLTAFVLWLVGEDDWWLPLLILGAWLVMAPVGMWFGRWLTDTARKRYPTRWDRELREQDQ